MSWNLTDYMATLAQAMTLCRQTTTHYRIQYWPRFMSPHGTTRPHWVLMRCPLCHFKFSIHNRLINSKASNAVRSGQACIIVSPTQKRLKLKKRHLMNIVTEEHISESCFKAFKIWCGVSSWWYMARSGSILSSCPSPKIPPLMSHIRIMVSCWGQLYMFIVFQEHISLG